MTEITADEVIQKIVTYSEVFYRAGLEKLLKDYPMMLTPFEMFLLVRKLNDSFMRTAAEVDRMVFYGVSLRVVE
jgi:hypothetical protein